MLPLSSDSFMVRISPCRLLEQGECVVAAQASWAGVREGLAIPQHDGSWRAHCDLCKLPDSNAESLAALCTEQGFQECLHWWPCPPNHTMMAPRCSPSPGCCYVWLCRASPLSWARNSCQSHASMRPIEPKDTPVGLLHAGTLCLVWARCHHPRAWLGPQS